MSTFHIKMHLKRLELGSILVAWNLIYVENKFITAILTTVDKLFY